MCRRESSLPTDDFAFFVAVMKAIGRTVNLEEV
jgi:hypothetical protein